MNLKAEFSRGHRLLLVGAVLCQFIVLLQGDALLMVMGWAASLICSALFVYRFLRARRQAGGSMILPVYMTFALICWLFWIGIAKWLWQLLGGDARTWPDWLGLLPFLGSLGMVIVGAVFVFREEEGEAVASGGE
jgi:hypothetical protein